MKTRWVAVALCCTTTLVVAQQAARDTAGPQRRGTAVIAGTIVAAADMVPVRGARVTLNGSDRSLPGRTATTDDDGRFMFRDLPAGRYRLRATKAAYLDAEFGAKRPDRPGTPVSVADGEQKTGMTMTLVRGSVISGTVVDETGQPLAGVYVSARRFGYVPDTGERTLNGVGYGAFGSTTDDRGGWRAWGLPPGEYLAVALMPGADRGRADAIRRLTTGDVERAIALARGGRGAAAANPALNESVLARAGEPVQFAPVFHPGTSDLVQAATVVLGLGDERAGVNIAFRRVPAVRVSGSVQLLDGMTTSDVRVWLVAGGSDGGLWSSLGIREADRSLEPDGTFTFDGVTPGRYVVEARPSGPAARTAWAQAEVTIDGRDERVILEMRPGMTITGRVVFDGATTPPKDASGARIFLRPPGAGANLSAGPPGGTVDADGRFSFTEVRPTTYRLSWSRSASYQSWFLSSVMANGRDALDFGLTVRPGETVALTAHFTDRPAELSGTLQSASGVPAPDHYIIVFAADRSFWIPGARRVQTLRPGDDGRYVWPNIPPGEYLIAALTDVDPGAWHSRAFLEELVPAAIRVTVPAGERKVQNIQLK